MGLNDIENLEGDPEGKVFFHTHNGVDAPKVDVNNLKNFPSQAGNSGKFLKTDGSALSFGSVTITPGGSDTQVQFNDGGVLGGNTGLTYDKAAGGSFIATAKQGSASGNGGAVTITAGDGGATTGSGGDASLIAGNATAGTVGGGSLILKSGNGHGGASGGQVTLLAGAGGATDFGGSVSLSAGVGGVTSGGGGNFSVVAGNAIAGNSQGGSLTLQAGTKAGSGTQGEVILKNGAGLYFKTGVDTFTYAVTVSLDVSLSSFHKTTTVDATGNATINASAGGNAGQMITITITNDATSGKTITFGTNFKPSGTIVGTTSKVAVIGFISDGANWYEQYRTLLL